MEQQNFFRQPDLGGVNPIDLNEALREANGKSKYNERMPQVGETVLFTPNPDDNVAKSNNNEDGPVAAIVTRVWSSVCVNIKIIPDHGPMQDRGSVTHASANPAGYHFKFMDEVYPPAIDPRNVVFGV